jgi:hypothetical protein
MQFVSGFCPAKGACENVKELGFDLTLRHLGNMNR